MKALISFIALFISLIGLAQGPYAPEVGILGSKAMHKDSSSFIAWASECTIVRGLQDIAQANSDTTNIGAASDALGIADGLGVVSLGDGGVATLQFQGAIYNGIGPDFAVFENAFNASFLELAFVEVSSDGQNFVRFPSHSLTDTTVAVGSFGAVDPTYVHNLAGKYQANYGTPFDLDELKNHPNLDVQNITHIRIVDVVGSLSNTHSRRDSQGRKINDQYPTPFPSGGFDLDAVGVVYLKTVGLEEHLTEELKVFPNPCSNHIQLNEKWLNGELSLFDEKGRLLKKQLIKQTEIEVSELPQGVYILHIAKEHQQGKVKLLKL